MAYDFSVFTDYFINGSNKNNKNNKIKIPSLYRGVSYTDYELFAKKLVNKLEWTYGSLITIPVMLSPIVGNLGDYKYECMYQIATIDEHFLPDWNMPYSLVNKPVLIKSIGVCTNCKDINDNYIFTGDIVKVVGKELEYTIGYDSLNGCFEGVNELNNICFNFCSSVADDLEIVDNYFNRFAHSHL